MSSKKPNNFILIAALIGLAIIGYLAYAVLGGSGSSGQAASGAQGQSAGQQNALPVTTTTLSPTQYQPSLIYPARLTPSLQVQIRPRVGGFILEQRFDEGQIVNKGDVLYRVNDNSLRADYESALASLNKAKANLKTVEAQANRYKALIEANAVSQQEYDDIMAAYDSAKADIEVARAAVTSSKTSYGYAQVKSPITGKTSASNYDIGALVSSIGAPVSSTDTMPLTTVTQLDPVEVELSLPSKDYFLIRDSLKQNNVSVGLVDANGQSIHPQAGQITFSDTLIDEVTDTLLLKAEFENADLSLLPGMFARAKLSLPAKSVYLVPQKYTVRSPEGMLLVWTVDENNQAQPLPIQASSSDQGNWIVEQGLSPETPIIIDNLQMLRMPGTPVKPSPKPSNDPQQAAEQRQ